MSEAALVEEEERPASALMVASAVFFPAVLLVAVPYGILEHGFGYQVALPQVIELTKSATPFFGGV